MYNAKKLLGVYFMKKHLLLLLALLFVSCSGSEEEENKSLNSTKSKATLSKTAEPSKNDRSQIYTNYKEAFAAAKTENRAVFILFSTEYCRWCTKLKKTTLEDAEIKAQLKKEFIVLFLDRDQDQYPSKYKIKGVPAVYMTDQNEEIFTSMVGYHKNPGDYLKWFNYIQIELGN